MANEPIKRLNYFTGQFLEATDFNDEQGYHTGMRQRGNRARFNAGVLDDGFQVAQKVDASGAPVDGALTIGAGMGVDRHGQEIVIVDVIEVAVPAYLLIPGTSFPLTLSHTSVGTDAQTAGDANSYRRWREDLPVPGFAEPAPSDDAIVIARVTVGTGAALAIDASARQMADVRVPGKLDRLDTVQSSSVVMRAYDLWFGHTARSGGPRRALVDLGQPGPGGTWLQVNFADSYAAGWDHVYIGGEVNWGLNSALTASQGGSIELGGTLNPGVVRTPYIDFHYKGEPDFNARIINDGDGRLNLIARTVALTSDAVLVGDRPVVTGKIATGTVTFADVPPNAEMGSGVIVPEVAGTDALCVHLAILSAGTAPVANLSCVAVVDAGTFRILMKRNGDQRGDAVVRWWAWRPQAVDSGQKRVELAIEVVPAAIALAPDATQRFTATVTGATDMRVTWTLPNGGGSIAADGTLKVNATSGSVFVVRATSVADPTKRRDATVSVTDASLTVSWAGSGSLLTGQTRQFAATVVGVTDKTVTWTTDPANYMDVTGAPKKFIDPASGLFTAWTGGSYSVFASSRAVSGLFGSAQVQVTGVAVVVNASATSVLLNATASFTATVSGTDNKAVTWSADRGTIDPNTGAYRATASGTATVIATSVADPTVTGRVLITVSAVALTVSPASARLVSGQGQTFSATVTGTGDPSVKWTVASGPGVIGQTSGVYVAGANAGTTDVTAVITATSVVSGTTANATITIVPAKISLTSTTAKLGASESFDFKASVAAVYPYDNLTWSATAGSMDSASGRFMAPGAAQTMSITATSGAGTSTGAVPLVVSTVKVSITADAGVQAQLTRYEQQLHADVPGVADTKVTWRITKNEVNNAGEIDVNGKFACRNPGGRNKVTDPRDPQGSMEWVPYEHKFSVVATHSATGVESSAFQITVVGWGGPL